MGKPPAFSLGVALAIAVALPLSLLLPLASSSQIRTSFPPLHLSLPLHLPFAFEIERGFSPASKPAAKRLILLALLLPRFIFLQIPPKNRMSSPKTT
jgi:hypothetical protein